MNHYLMMKIIYFHWKNGLQLTVKIKMGEKALELFVFSVQSQLLNGALPIQTTLSISADIEL